MKISQNKITFLENISKDIDVIKNRKSYFFKSFLIQNESISDFVYDIPINDVYWIVYIFFYI